MILPRYYLLGERPAKIARMEDGRVGAYIFNRETGEFDLNAAVFNRLTKADNENVTEVSEAEFLNKVAELRNMIRGRKS